MCTTSWIYSRIQIPIFSLTGKYNTNDICKGLINYEESWELRSELPFSREIMTQLVGVSPLEDLFYNSIAKQFYCLIIYAEGDAMFQALRKVLFED